MRNADKKDTQFSDIKISHSIKANAILGAAPRCWRKRWDSNPRGLAPNTISSRARYDHFDTLPYDLKSTKYIIAEKQSDDNRFRKKEVEFFGKMK